MYKKNQTIISLMLTVCVLMMLLPIGIGKVYADPGDVDDITSPSITRVEVESGTFVEGDSFVVTVYAVDEESGIPQSECGIVRLISNNEDGSGSIVREEKLSGNGSGVYIATFNVSNTYVSGDYQIELVDIYNNEGNHIRINTWDDSELIPDTIIHISTSNTDREGPRVSRIEAESAEITSGNSFRISVFATDESGLDGRDPGWVQVRRISQEGEYQQEKSVDLIRISENLYEAEFAVNDSWITGEYVISCVYLRDNNGFTTCITEDNQLLSDVSYSIVTNNTDAFAPVITGAELETQSAGLGDVFTVKVYAENDEDLSEYPGVVWISNSNNSDEYYITNENLHKIGDGEYEAVFMVAVQWPSGEYSVSEIQLWDSSNNITSLSGDTLHDFSLGTVTVDYEAPPEEPEVERPEITCVEFDKSSYSEGDTINVFVSVNNRETAVRKWEPGWLVIERIGQDGDDVYKYGEYLEYVEEGKYKCSIDTNHMLSGEYRISVAGVADEQDEYSWVYYFENPDIVSQETVYVTTRWTDPIPPVIDSVEMETQTVQDGESFEVIVRAHDHESGIRDGICGQVTLRSEEGREQYGQLEKINDNMLVARFTVDYWAADEYKIYHVDVSDAQGNISNLFMDDGNSILPNSVITAVTDNNDFDPPVLTSVELGDVTSATVGESIEVYVQAYDELNEIDNDYPGYVAILRDGEGNDRSFGYEAELIKVSDSLYKATFVVLDDWYAGKYHVDHVQVKDTHHNYLYYYNNGYDQNLLPSDVIVISTKRTDAEYPVITKVEVPELEELHVGDSFEVRVYGTDNVGISEENPGDVNVCCHTDYNYIYQDLVKENGFYKAVFTVTNNWKPGLYTIEGAALQDDCDNREVLWPGCDEFPMVSFTVVNDNYEEPVVPEPEPSDGWVMDNDGFRYEYADGSYPVDEWDFIQDKWYHFDEQGYMQSGWLKLDDNWYYLNLTDFEGRAIGWKEINKTKYFFSDDGIMQTGWKKINDKWYYFRGSGAMTTGWGQIDGKWYYFNSDGSMATGWKQIDGLWYYLNQSGSMVTGWGQIDGKWYYFNDNGVMQTGWQKINDTWYYFNQSGSMVTGWGQIDGKWYYFNSNGAMATGWKQLNGAWYYLNQSGSMVTGWGQIGGKWYYFNSNGVMQTGWQKINDTWYYFDNSGSMATGWRQINNTWYYMDQSGAMVSGWRQINGKWYYFNSDGSMVSEKWVGDYYLTESGAMATDQWIGNYYVDSNGKWVPDKKK